MKDNEDWIEDIIPLPHIFRLMKQTCEKISNSLDRLGREAEEVWVPRTRPELMIQFKLEMMHDGEIDISWACDGLKKRKDVGI